MVAQRRHAYLACLIVMILLWYFWPTEQIFVDVGQSPVSSVTLNNGLEMPILGFGTAGIRHHQILETAFSAGYRLFDTASDTGPWYRTEDPIGRLLVTRQTRPELFLVTKLHPEDHGNAMESFSKSITNLRTDYVDLYLLHYPECWSPMCKKEPRGTWKDSWKSLEILYHDKKIKALGVSNFNVQQLESLLELATVKPAVVQGWYDPFHRDDELVKFCKSHNIQFMAYSSLGTQWQIKTGKNIVLENPDLKKLAEKYGKTISQIVLKWVLKKGIVAIPASNNPTHVKQNFNLFGWDLTTEDIKIIDGLKQEP